MPFIEASEIGPAAAMAKNTAKEQQHHTRIHLHDDLKSDENWMMT